MSSLIAIFGAIFAFFIVVVVHEFGHFIVARWVGIKVIRFAIGFGKPILTYRGKSGVEYAIGYLPLGGYVKMQDAFSEPEENVGSSGTAYESKSVLARMAVVLAGPIANFILAWLIFCVVFCIGVSHIKPIVGAVSVNSVAEKAGLRSGDQIVKIQTWSVQNWQQVVMSFIENVGDRQDVSMTVMRGNPAEPIAVQLDLQHWQFDPMKPDLLASVGLTPFFPRIPPVVAWVVPHSPAEKGGLLAGDVITAVDQQPITDWQTFVKWIEKHPSQTVLVHLQRNGVAKTLSVVTGEKNQMGFLGVQSQPLAIPDSLKSTERYPWYATPTIALTEIARWGHFQLVVLKQMITGHISPKAMGGPVSIFQTAGAASLQGLVVYLQFIALISVVLGVLNLLPIPGLDGGHFVFCLIEGLTGKPLPLRVQIMLINMGMLMLILLMLYATTNDIARLFQ